MVVDVDVVAVVVRVAVAAVDVRRSPRVTQPAACWLGPRGTQRRPNAASVCAGQLDAQAVAAFGEAARIHARVGARSHRCALLFRVLERVRTRAGDARSVDEARSCRQVGVAGLISVTYASRDAVALRLAFGLGEAIHVLAIDFVVGGSSAIATARAGLSDFVVLYRVDRVGSLRAARERQDKGRFAGHVL